MQKYIRHKSKKKDGITLIALVITIIVLLILAGISISMLSGDNTILGKTAQARDETEIAEEKEMIKMASMQALIEKKHGNISKTELSIQLENVNSSKPTSVDSDEELNLLIVTFKNSGRVYQIDSNGNVTYIGQENDLKNAATITASPESNTTPQLVQYIDLKIETFLKLEDDEIFVHYAWTNEENKTPSNSDYASAMCNVNSNKKRRSVTLTNEDTAEGNYYLWIQVVFNGNTITKKYGPYAVKNHTTLVATNKETAADSGFLGNTDLPRNKIRSVTIKNSFGTHGADEKSWDVSASQNGTYLAWSKATTDETDGTYYDVIIEGKGGVVANTNAAYLFANIGNGLTNQEVTITGLKYLDTGLVTNMYDMFGECSKITSLDVSNFDTRNVKSTRLMFSGCCNLIDLDVSNFDTSNVTNITWMFNNCGCQTINVSKMNTRNVTEMNEVFRGCSKLTNIDVGNFDTSNVTSMSGFFSGCSSLESLNVSNFDTSKVTNMNSFFMRCSNLTTLDISNFNTSNVTSMTDMFYGCSGLTDLDLSNFNTSNVTSMAEMFCYSSGLMNINVSSFKTSKVNNMQRMFDGCSKLTNIDVTKFDTSNVTSMYGFFRGCSKLTNLNVSKFDTSKVTTMESMFQECSVLTNLDVTRFNTTSVTNMKYMFYKCNSLMDLNVTKFDTSSVTNMQGMFANCSGLTSLDVTKFNTSNVTNMHGLFYECNSLTDINVTKFDTNCVTSTNRMFYHCLKLTNIDLANFDTSNVIDMEWMFNYCSNLTTIYVGDKWNIANATSSDGMFAGCGKLVGDIRYNSSYTDKTYATKTGGYMTYKPST